MPTGPERESAARNNAEWCHAVCSTHGLRGEWRADLWSSPRRTPPFYPDAVTLLPGADTDRVLARVDDAPGCSVKDSFADLDLAGHGFETVVAARWIHHPPPDDRSDGTYEEVRSAAELARWMTAWNGGTVPSAPVLVPALLDVPGVTVLAVRDGDRMVGGAILNDTGDVAGVSNVFAAVDGEAVWGAVVAAASRLVPGRALVGYEHGADLDAALRAGFEAGGELRVWLRPDRSTT